MGELFADAGYATGMFGKWHLGKTPNDTIVVWASDNGSGITSGEAWGSGGYWRGVFGGGWEGSYRSPAMLMTSEMTYAWVIGLASQPLLELAKSATQYRHIEPGEDFQCYS